MLFLDSHAHITPRWFPNPSKIIEDVKESLAGLVLIGLDPDEYQFLINLMTKEPDFIRIAFGISPSYVHKINAEQYLHDIESKIQESQTVHAVGEIGLDYYHISDKTLQKHQETLFIKGIQLANENNLPLVIHSRAAEARTVELLAKHAETIVLLHCFGGRNQVSQACDRGFFISVPTAVTYRREFKEVAQQVPLEYLLIETDSPFLSPIRKQRQNTPKNVSYAAKEIAKIRNLPLEDVAKVTTKNAQKIFWKTP